MILKKIKIHNFKSIYGDFELNFDDIKGFWKIEGAVGSGKTSIGEAIIFGLFGDIKGKNNKDLISWGEKKGNIYIECVSKDKHLEIYREIHGELKVLVDGEPLVFTNKRNAQQQLQEEYYDISKMTLELLCIISFNNFKSLSNMTPADTRAFLDQVFGFSVLTEYSDKCKNFKKEVTSELLKTEYKHANIVSQINKIKEISNIQKIEGNLSQIKSEIENNNKQKQEFNTKYLNWSKTFKNKIQEKQNELTKIKTLGANKAKEIKFIEQGNCPTCGAAIDQSQLEIKRQEREAFLTQYNTIDKDIKELNEQYNKENKQWNDSLNEFTKINNELISLKTKLEEQEKRLSINTQEISLLKKQKQDIDNELVMLKKDESEWTQLFDILGSDVRKKILNSFIPLLNKSIQNYTQQLNLPYIIEFDDQFKCSIKLFCLNKDVNISCLSTGQLKTIDMCIILGVLKVIFSGVNFNVMFLDELFSNMDSELRTVVCNMLKNELKENQTIFIISHQEIYDTNFKGTISARLLFKNNIDKSVYTIKEM